MARAKGGGLGPALLAAACAAPLAAGPAQEPEHHELLPPPLAWSGASESLAAAPGDPRATPGERSGLSRSPSLDETRAWLERLAAAAPELALLEIGASAEGRPILMVVASREGAAQPDALRRNGRPTLLVQAGIHAGEIDGNDAGQMLLRDMTAGGRAGELLDGANMLFVPVLNVDGHARSSPHGRINQRGPERTGWRTNARNLNLNRDYAKLDTPELRAVVGVLNRWPVDLYVDVHVTDGMDYQYDVTFGSNGPHAWSPAIAAWLERRARPALLADLERAGHVPGPLVLGVDEDDPGRGFYEWTASPRFSNGYGDARHLATVLVENHSLKPFRQRVLGTRVFLESALRVLAAEWSALRRAVREDRARLPPELPLGFGVSEGTPPRVPFQGVAWRHEPSTVSGARRLIFTGRPVEIELPLHRMTRPTAVASRPAAWWVPAAWPEVIDRLECHGVRLERIAAARELDVEMYRMSDVVTGPAPVEGRTTVAATPAAERRRERFAAGSARIPAGQPLGDLAMLLLEPQSPDSFFAWGFFNETLQRSEYVEGYVIEPLAERMLEEDPELALAFEQRLADDPAFARDPEARRRFFYERTPHYDERHRLYPVARELPQGR